MVIIALHFASFSILLIGGTQIKRFTDQPIVFDDVSITNDGTSDIIFGDGTTMKQFLRNRSTVDYKSLDILQFWMNCPTGSAIVSCSGTWSD